MLMQMNQFMLNQILYPFGREEDHSPMKEEFPFLRA